VVDLELSRPALDENGIVCDIGLLSEILASVLKPLNYQNLDELSIIEGKNTTTEVLAEHIAGQVAGRIREGALGAEAGAAMAGVKVTLGESHVAWASYEMSL
jgi:6-pyruvoyl-tetrahydropterin synthase